MTTKLECLECTKCGNDTFKVNGWIVTETLLEDEKMKLS